MTPAEVIALSHERDMHLRRLLACERAAYRAGYDHGFTDGSEKLYACRRVLPPVVLAGESFAELERKRWGPAGREHFADPRDGDGHAEEVRRAAGRGEPL